MKDIGVCITMEGNMDGVPVCECFAAGSYRARISDFVSAEISVKSPEKRGIFNDK